MGHIPPLFYAVASILVGSALITYILGFIKLDITPVLRSKAGKPIHSVVQCAYEQLLRTLSVSDPTIPPSVPSSLPSRGYLENLPARAGPRPTISGTSQPKQTTQLLCSDTEVKKPLQVRDVITVISARNSRTTYLGSSTFEVAGPVTMFACHRAFDETRYYGEILRADRAGGLIECSLHPNDVKTVVEKGWGQRHPLSTRLASCFVTPGSKPGPSPQSKVVLYAFRTQADLEVLERIIRAAVWWVGGVDSRLDDEKA